MKMLLKRLNKFIIDLKQIGFKYFILQTIYRRFKRSPEGKWIIGWKDAKRIYRLIKSTDAQNVLELGTGIGASTAIMAFAVGKKGKITTLEQNEKCLKLAKALMPPKLLSRVNFIFSEPVAFESPIIPGQTFSGYKKLPIDLGPFDFVLVDGPSGWIENSQSKKFPNGDIVKLIPHLKTGCLVYVDSRRNALEIYLAYLQPYLKVKTLWRTLSIMERTEVTNKI